MKTLIPLINKKSSKDIDDNCLFSPIKNCYVMDNHRLALWCWLQSVSTKSNLIHIDAHPDLSRSGVEKYNRQTHPIEKMTLDEYRFLKQEEFNVPLFRWDNYLTFFCEYYQDFINQDQSYSFTFKMGSQKKLTHDCEAIYLLSFIEGIVSNKKFYNLDPWILNLDLDYFFSSAPQKILMFSEDYLQELGRLIRIGVDQRIISVFTMALSPECCGSWDNAIWAYNVINRGLKFSLVIE